MIKINLVGEGKKPVAAKKGVRRGAAGAPSLISRGSDKGALYLTLAFVALAAVGCVAWGIKLERQKRKLDAEIATAQVRVDALEEILKRVEEYKRKEEELTKKIEVITSLKTNQKGPVRLMDEVSKGLPELLWLDTLELQGASLTINGRSMSVNAIATFAENLTQVPNFQEPKGPDIQRQGEVFTFAMSFAFDPAVITAGSGAAAAAGESQSEPAETPAAAP